MLRPELQKGGILVSRIPDIFFQESRHLLVKTSSQLPYLAGNNLTFLKANEIFRTKQIEMVLLTMIGENILEHRTIVLLEDMKETRKIRREVFFSCRQLSIQTSVYPDSLPLGQWSIWEIVRVDNLLPGIVCADNCPSRRLSSSVWTKNHLNNCTVVQIT